MVPALRVRGVGRYALHAGRARRAAGAGPTARRRRLERDGEGAGRMGWLGIVLGISEAYICAIKFGLLGGKVKGNTPISQN